MRHVVDWGWLGLGALYLVSGTTTLVRHRIAFGRRLRNYDWRLAGWSEISGGISWMVLTAAFHARSYGLFLVPLLAFMAFQTASIGLFYRARPARSVAPVSTRPLSYTEWQWWWYDRPIARDWLFWTGLLASGGVFIAMLFAGEFGFPFFLLFPGCLGCAARNFYRRRRESSGPDTSPSISS